MAPSLFPRLCVAQGLPEPVPEYRFAAPERNWRMDFAWVAQRVFLECHGGVYVQGRHVRGAGWQKDADKSNEASARGWRMLLATPKTLCSPPTFALLKRALDFTPDAA